MINVDLLIFQGVATKPMPEFVTVIHNGEIMKRQESQVRLSSENIQPHNQC